MLTASYCLHQDLFNIQYCNIQSATLASMGNPNVAGNVVPASALSTQSGGEWSLTSSGWALIAGIIVVVLLIAYCCYRRGIYQRCMRSRRPPGDVAPKRGASTGGSGRVRSNLRRLSSSSLHALRRLVALRQMRDEAELIAVRTIPGGQRNLLQLCTCAYASPSCVRQAGHHSAKHSPAVHPLSAVERSHHRRRARRDDDDWSGAEYDEEAGAPSRSSKKRPPKTQEQGTSSPSPGMALPQHVVMLPTAPAWPPAVLSGGGTGLPLHVGMAPPGAGGLSVYSNAAYADPAAQQLQQQQQQQLIALATAIMQQQSQHSPPPCSSLYGGAPHAPPEWPQFSPPGRGHTSRMASPGSTGTRTVGRTRREALRSLARELEEAAADGGEDDEGREEDGSRCRATRARVPRRTRDGGADSDGDAEAAGREGREDALDGRVRSSAGAPERRLDGIRA